MGISLSWLAVHGKSAEQVRTELGLRSTGRVASYPEVEYSDVTLANGWHIVALYKETTLSEDNLLGPMSKGCEVVGGFSEEHTSFITASYWSNCVLVWSATVEGGGEPVEFEGIDLAKIEAIRQASMAELADEVGEEDLEEFEVDGNIPFELARELTGFVYYEQRDDEEANPFRELVPINFSIDIDGKPLVAADLLALM